MRQNLLNLGRQNQQKHVTPLIQTQNLISWTYVSFSIWQVHLVSTWCVNQSCYKVTERTILTYKL